MNFPIGALAREFEAIDAHWSPRVVAIANGQYVKLAKVLGSFVWHAHAGEDEFFLVLRGSFVLEFRDRPRVVLNPGDFYVVPKGVEHLPSAAEECWLLFVEPAETAHTGEAESPLAKSIEAQVAHLR